MSAHELPPLPPPDEQNVDLWWYGWYTFVPGVYYPATVERLRREAYELGVAQLHSVPAVDRDAVLEEAAKVCDGIADASWHAYKDRYSQHRADPHYQGKSDGAEDCAIAIRALKGQTR